MAADLPTAAAVTSGTTTNAQQKLNLAAWLNATLGWLGAKFGIGPQTVASAGTLNLEAVTDTRDLFISGTTAITAVTIEAGKVFRCRASGGFTLTNNASIVTHKGADIVCEVGDSFLLRATAANVVEVFGFVRGVPAVLVTGTQTIGGSKTFSSGVTMPTLTFTAAAAGTTYISAGLFQVAMRDSVGYSLAAAVVYCGRDSASGRSMNLGGTVNASGTDYAEYMRKAINCGAVAKGQIVGINSNGEVTDRWADSIAFAIKSTDPSYVGGDVWGTPEALGLDADSEEFAQVFEAERQKYDRIAFSGQVPVNVNAATPGQYIVPVQDGGGIVGIAVTSPSLAQYLIVVGKVIAIEPDGRPRVIVKVA